MQTTEELISVSDPGEVGKEEHNRGDRFVVHVSNIFAWLFPILMIAICAQVVLRTSGVNQAWLDDLQWWLYGASALMAIAYAVTTDSHVRVDILHEHFSETRKNRIEIFALVWLFMPFIILCWDFTLAYAISSVTIDEGSDSPNGLHNLWILKVFMNVAFAFIGVAIWSAYVRFLSRMTRPVLWKQLFWAFPSTFFLVNLFSYYAIWWYLRLTTPADVSDRDIGRFPVFGYLEVGAEEIKWTVIIGFVGTVVLIVIARLFDRGDRAEG
jgi:TRAP-type mannitol/chloroaromatic compound transport system permease small subunit